MESGSLTQGPVGDTGLAVRIGALLLAGGAVLSILATVLPHASQLDTAGFLATAGLQLVLAAFLLKAGPRLPHTQWLLGAITAAGILAVTAAVHFNGERAGGPPMFLEFFYVWPAFYAGYFLKPRGVVAGFVATAVAYGAVVLEMRDESAAGLTRWVVTLSVLGGAAIAMHALRRNIDDLVAQLRDTARTDPLTGLLNRRGFDERFALELERSARSGEPLAVVVGDLDFFKDLNDRFGHGAGDAALVCVAQTLASGCRAIDTVARVGGEEFAMLIPASDARGGLLAAERLRKSVSGIVDGDGRPLTISFGVVDLPHHGSTAQELLYSVDRALYRAKEAGRDRSVVSPAPAEPAVA